MTRLHLSLWLPAFMRTTEARGCSGSQGPRSWCPGVRGDPNQGILTGYVFVANFPSCPFHLLPLGPPGKATWEDEGNWAAHGLMTLSLERKKSGSPSLSPSLLPSLPCSSSYSTSPVLHASIQKPSVARHSLSDATHLLPWHSKPPPTSPCLWTTWTAHGPQCIP